jgi:hypothetical protein
MKWLPLIFLGMVIFVLAGSTVGFANLRNAPLNKATGFVGGTSHTAKATGYIISFQTDLPGVIKAEGGVSPHDRCGKQLHTVQDFVEGKAPYVSVSMDRNLAEQKFYQPAGCDPNKAARLRIPELEQAYNHGHFIDFRLVDTGSTSEFIGYGRVDICVQRGKDSPSDTESKRVADILQYTHEKSVNGQVTLIFEGSSPSSAPTTTSPLGGLAPAK